MPKLVNNFVIRIFRTATRKGVEPDAAKSISKTKLCRMQQHVYVLYSCIMLG